MAWTTKFTDAFTNSNGTDLDVHDATWVLDQLILEIQSNAVAASTADFALAHISTSLENKQAAEADMLSDNDFNGVIVRYTSQSGSGDDWDGYSGLWRLNVVYSYKRISGGTPSWSLLGSTSVTHNSGDTLRVEVDGSSIQVLVNDVVKVGPHTDSDYASGQAAIRCGLVAGTIDNFKAEDEAVVPAGGQVITIIMSKLIVPLLYLKQGKTKRRGFLKNTLLALIGIK